MTTKSTRSHDHQINSRIESIDYRNTSTPSSFQDRSRIYEENTVAIAMVLVETKFVTIIRAKYYSPKQTL